MIRTLAITAAFSLSLLGTTSHAKAPCGGSFKSFLNDFKREAKSKGHDGATIDKFLRNAAIDKKVLKADRSQGVFKKSFIDFSRAVISKNRLQHGQKNAKKYASIFNRAEKEYGVSRGVLLAFWALETDYGAFQGNFNTLNALLTLSHDCRRPDLFRPQLFAALKLYERGDFHPVKTKGAWAGEIGMVQMLPEDIIHHGTDGDGDGKVSLKTSPPDALLSGAKMLRSLGWAPGQPWLQEIKVPANLDWSKTGLNQEFSIAQWQKMGVKPAQGGFKSTKLKGSILLPMGRKGPAFMAYPNYRVYFEWNKSFVYVTTAAYFATRLEGAKSYDPRNPDAPLSDRQMKSLQKKLRARGHDVGKIDGILGAKTRAAVQAEQIRLKLPADAWPTPELLKKL
ncbi:MAG: lytic murein transglycosylase [Halocynthiibacter sp.]